jgi:hypothetical protein
VLPDGIDDAFRQVVGGRRDGGDVNTLCALAAEASPNARRRGLAADLLQGPAATACSG